MKKEFNYKLAYLDLGNKITDRKYWEDRFGPGLLNATERNAQIFKTVADNKDNYTKPNKLKKKIKKLEKSLKLYKSEADVLHHLRQTGNIIEDVAKEYFCPSIEIAALPVKEATPIYSEDNMYIAREDGSVEVIANAYLVPMEEHESVVAELNGEILRLNAIIAEQNEKLEKEEFHEAYVEQTIIQKPCEKLPGLRTEKRRGLGQSRMPGLTRRKRLLVCKCENK